MEAPGAPRSSEAGLWLPRPPLNPRPLHHPPWAPVSSPNTSPCWAGISASPEPLSKSQLHFWREEKGVELTPLRVLKHSHVKTAEFTKHRLRLSTLPWFLPLRKSLILTSPRERGPRKPPSLPRRMPVLGAGAPHCTQLAPHYLWVTTE